MQAPSSALRRYRVEERVYFLAGLAKSLRRAVEERVPRFRGRVAFLDVVAPRERARRREFADDDHLREVRDFGLRLSVASGITTAPELVLPQGVTCENADGEVPEIGADGAATILYFTETASGVFLVKGEVVTAIS